VVWADEPAKKLAQKKWLIDRTLTISPRAEPRPALKYRLMPSSWERKPGNAVPIYLRLVHEQSDARRQLWREMPAKWNQMPLDRMPLSEARKFLEGRRYMLRQLELGARRQTAEWEYTLDAGDPIGLLLPDVQNMRAYIPLLVLQARVALAEKDPATAIHHLETGFAISQHIGEAPFLISSLVAVATSSILSDAVTELVEQSDAPNLYWALSALPRPLIRMSKAMDFERAMMKLQFPDLADLDRARSAEQWDEVLKRVRKEFERLNHFERKPRPLPEGRASTDPASKSPELATARKYLIEQRRLPEARVKQMPDAQVLVLWLANIYDDLADDTFKTTYLPYVKALPMIAAVDKRLKETPNDEGHRLARLLLPAVNKVRDAQTRLDRRIAALRVIEALRLHAAANGGKLPEKLSDITLVPVPNDPGTEKPFDYKSDPAKGTATLGGTIPAKPLETTGIRYQLKVRRAKGGA
jgi:hypothetical protein